MATALAQITVEEFERLPESDRHYELVDGVVVEKDMARAEHEIVKVTLNRLLIEKLDGTRFDVLPESRHNLSKMTAREPDLAIWRCEDLDAVDPSRTLNKGPLIAIEVVSSESAADLEYKTDQYIRAGTELVWIVYPKTRSVFAQWSDHHGVRFGPEDKLNAGDVIPELTIAVSAIFARLIKIEAHHPTPR